MKKEKEEKHKALLPGLSRDSRNVKQFQTMIHCVHATFTVK
jgi:hypothetical protein